ncbi:hypothetical protein [Protofrankia sp. BMG5.30]|uniref:hypothetical protein n=1 Tax=Protofrankia sp. BMG5.30 TaxID=1834514 RepID=UPI0009767131|nr:hypothetical protein [Protofrankia sp. BMG5.30]ONH32706.1 hypothetical protein BL254_21220 [Protofrankia sp. BMG5.30]
MTGPTATPDAGGGRGPVGSHGHISVHIGSGWSARCFTYPHERPILAVDADHTHLSLSATDDAVTVDHLAFARALVRAATDYLHECERLLTGRTTDASTGDTATAA